MKEEKTIHVLGDKIKGGINMSKGNRYFYETKEQTQKDYEKDQIPVAEIELSTERETSARVPNNETKAENVLIDGIVTDCNLLNIRKYSNIHSEIVTVVSAGTRIKVNPDESTYEWLSVNPEPNVKGFCLSKYVSLDGE